MPNKQKFLISFFSTAVFCIFSNARVWASSTAHELFIADPGKVLMVDGKDRYSQVVIKAKLDSAEYRVFDFGFMNGDAYVPMTSKLRGFHAYTFAGNDRVDFALRNSGTDRLFGTSDDFIYRLSDNAKYAQQHYFLPAKSSRTKAAPSYFRALRLDWDIDLNGSPDAHAFLEIKRGKYDGMMPAPTSVPVLPAAWFLGSGILGLMLMTRRHGARAWRERSR